MMLKIQFLLPVYISCTAGFMRVCYLPHSDPPYEILSSRLYNQQAVSYVSGGMSTTDECRLQPENGVGVRYCVKIRLQSRQADNCGIRAYKMKVRLWSNQEEGLFESMTKVEPDSKRRTHVLCRVFSTAKSMLYKMLACIKAQLWCLFLDSTY